VIFPLGTGVFNRFQHLSANPRFRLYLAIDKGTFSAAKDDTEYFKSSFLEQMAGVHVDMSRVLVIGAPTGGKPAEYSNVQPFTLPGSGLSGQYSTKFDSPPAGIPAGPALDPDIAISIRSTDYFARFDPVMAAILARSSGAPAAPSGAVTTVNGASFRVDQGVAPGSVASAFGSFAQPPDEIWVGNDRATLISAAASQVNFVVPLSASPGRSTISVRAAGVEQASGKVTISATGPGLFILNAMDPAQPGAVENQDYSVNRTANPAAKGSVIQIFATGYGPLDATGSAPVSVYFGDTPAVVVYSAPVPQFPGVWQINAQVPAGITGHVPISLIAGSLASNAVTVAIQ